MRKEMVDHPFVLSFLFQGSVLREKATPPWYLDATKAYRALVDLAARLGAPGKCGVALGFARGAFLCDLGLGA